MANQEGDSIDIAVAITELMREGGYKDYHFLTLIFNGDDTLFVSNKIDKALLVDELIGALRTVIADLTMDQIRVLFEAHSSVKH